MNITRSLFLATGLALALVDSAVAAPPPSAQQLEIFEASRSTLLSSTNATSRQSALSELKALAEQNVPQALLFLGNIYLGGTSVERDPIKGERYLSRAAASGNGSAYISLGNMYRRGDLGAPAPKKAFEAYTQANAAGAAGVKGPLGAAYFKGEGVERDVAKGLTLLKEAADTGDAEALALLGESFLNGTGVPADSNRAVEYLEQAADAGSTFLLLRLGDIFRTGEGVEPDGALAEEYYLKAAEAGVGIANLRLGDMYSEGVLFAPDQDLSASYYKRAAAEGSEAGNIRLAAQLLKSAGDADLFEAMKLLEQQAATSPAAAVLLAQSHMTGGFGIHSDRDKGYQSLVKLASDEVGNAAPALAIMTYFGRAGIEKSPETAISMLEKSSSNGNILATRTLIGLHRDAPGDAIERSIDEARSLLNERANQFSPDLLGQEEALLQAAQGKNEADFAGIDEIVRTLSPLSKRDAVFRIADVNPNAFVYLTQTALQQRGIYGGEINGLLTSTTIRAIIRLCEERQAAADCKKGPLRREAISLISSIIAAPVVSN